MDKATFVYVVIPAGFLVYALIFGLLGAYIARQKGRSGNEGAIFGILLAVVGLLIEALLPSRD